MATVVIMPRQGQSVESCLLNEWQKKVGDEVAIGDVLFSYETDKASFEEEATVSGTMLYQMYEEGDDVTCLENVCIIGTPGEDYSEYVVGAELSEEPIVAQDALEEVVTQITSSQQTITNITASNSEKVSPRAKALAAKLSIDVQMAQATGPKGRVIERDILKLKELGIFSTQAALASGETLPESGSGIGGRIVVGDLSGKAEVITANQVMNQVPNTLGYRDEKIPNIRKMIAKAMMNSLSTTSQLTLTSSFDATDLMAIRSKMKASKVDFNVTLTDMILYAVSRTLKDFPALNAHFLGDTMRYFDQVHLGLAVDTDRGLLVPTIFNADSKSLVEISSAVKSVAEMSKTGTINPDLLTGASFTITNLGTFGIESFTPVLNPPQTGILGVNTITQRVREVDGVISTYPAMGLSLTFDHGAIDGAPAARYLQALTKALENFTILLMQ